VSNVTLQPLAIGNESDAPLVIQTITWTNFPPLTDLEYRVPQDLGMIGFDKEADYGCTGGGGGYWGDCRNLPSSGSGQLQVRYSPRLVTADYADCACTFSESVEVRVQALSLDTSGTVAVQGRADLTLNVTTPDQRTIDMTVYDHGPTNAAKPVVTISGFAQTVTFDRNSALCTSSGSTVTCGLSEIAATASGSGDCQPTTTPPICDGIILTMQAGWTSTRLTVRVSGYYPDPDLSSNTGIAFPDAAPAPSRSTTPPPPRGGSGTNSASTPPPSASATASAAPSQTLQPTTAPGDLAAASGVPTTGAAAEPPYTVSSGLPRLWFALAIGLLLLMAGGGVLTAVLLRRQRPGPGQPSGM
jgi:hypothetical protein